jgi:hypothetical protein
MSDMEITTNWEAVMLTTIEYGIEIVYVGSAGHLRRYKVVDSNGTYVKGGLFRTEIEAHNFMVQLSK